MNNEFTLTALSPLDGRYREKVSSLSALFSEYGLIKYRFIVEMSWLEALSTLAKLPELPPLTKKEKKILHQCVNQFTEKNALRIKTIEATIQHDVKAVEYFIKEQLQNHTTLAHYIPFIHFGCTSEDINNLAYGLMLKTARETVLVPLLKTLLQTFTHHAKTYATLPMLARTHGQAATPTTVGKEFANVAARLKRQIDQLIRTPLLGKLNGASGNYNALHVAYPAVNWRKISEQFVKNLGLTWNAHTTQIEPHDTLSELFAIVMRLNVILIDFSRDIWAYIAIGYFNQKATAQEVGSSVMPHKINPIHFENAEGNLGIANALLEHMIVKLPISRWQRDLSDSTVLRNIGIAIGHSYLAYQMISQGLSKITPDRDVIMQDLNQHWEILAEPIQTMMRRFHIPDAYEQLKQLTRGQTITQETVQKFIRTLALPASVKKQLLALTPANYLGYASELAKDIALC